jgi:ubiquinone/menaquinone biosynthesis C-methylase UbiE
MKLTDILRCPKTHNSLRFEEADSLVRVENSDLTYPVVDGIIDFCPDIRDRVSRSYDRIASCYDTYITSANVFMRLCNTVIWGISDDRSYADTLLSYLPPRFDGVLLDVPVGTGVFTASVYARYPDATVIAVDYSMQMLRRAAARFRRQGLKNVRLLRADVAALPLADASADIVLSMNGLHAFPDKQRAVAQMRRVLRPNAPLIACCYVTGQRKLSDFFVRHFGARRGFFNPPFLDGADIGSQLDGFTVTRQGNLKSIAWFEALSNER